MSSSYLPSEELLHLLAVLADGDLTEEQERRLAEILRQDQQARTYYLDYVAMLTSLQWEYAAAAAPSEPSGTSPQPSRPRRRTRFLLGGAVGLAGLAAGLLLALVLLWQRPPDAAGPAEDRAEPTDNSVAVLLQALGAEWGETDMPTRPGASLPPGRLHLKAGLAHIQFYSGATVILEGPADLQLISPLEAYCARGKLRATVPPHAQGFTIGSPKLELVDRGTEFGLRVDGIGKGEIHVFQGKVELYDAGSNRAAASRQELTTGQGLRLDGQGARNPIASDAAAFLTVQDLAARSEAQAQRRHQRWRTASEALGQDPRLLVYYTFQDGEPWDRTLRDQVQGRQPLQDGTIVGCEWTTGRWPGKKALEFKRPGDRVRINVPGEYEALTFMAWVRIEAQEHTLAGLLLGDEWGKSTPHWQIYRDGKITLGVRHSDAEFEAHVTPPVLGPASYGEWIQLAAVYDSRARTVTHYVNGRAVISYEMQYPRSLKIGPAEIGNWRAPPQGHQNLIRNLNGRMDEFLLFNQALEALEIQDLYQAGAPNS